VYLGLREADFLQLFDDIGWCAAANGETSRGGLLRYWDWKSAAGAAPTQQQSMEEVEP
jgi:hypothetical protein